MPSTHSSPIIHYWAGKYPGKLGWLVGPSVWPKKKVRSWLPYALDNDAFSSWSKGLPWDETAFWRMLDLASQEAQPPLWALVPDVVADRNGTLARWYELADRVSEYGWPLAFAVQDGMTPSDVPDNAAVVFVGGSTVWKWRNVAGFCAAFPRVHIGRVNTIDRLWLCQDLGAESVDGTGWFREGETSRKLTRLESFLSKQREAELFTELAR